MSVFPTDLGTLASVDNLRAAHLVIMAMAFGIMMARDLNLLHGAGDRITDRTIGRLGLVHLAMMVAIGLAWASGCALAVIEAGEGGIAATGGLLTRLAVILALGVAALGVHWMVMPALRRTVGSALIDADFDDKIRIAVCASISVSTWVSAMILAAAMLMQAERWGVLLPVFGAIYLCSFAFALRYAVALHNRTIDERSLVSKVRMT